MRGLHVIVLGDIVCIFVRCLDRSKRLTIGAETLTGEDRHDVILMFAGEDSAAVELWSGAFTLLAWYPLAAPSGRRDCVARAPAFDDWIYFLGADMPPTIPGKA